MKAPVWLLPASLDLVAFVLVLFGAAAKPAPIVARAKRRQRWRAKPAPKVAALRVVAVA